MFGRGEKTIIAGQAREVENVFLNNDDEKAKALLAWWNEVSKTLGNINREKASDVQKVQRLLDAAHEKFHDIAGFVALYDLHHGINGSPEQKALLERLQKMMLYGDKSISSLEGIKGVSPRLTKLSPRRKKTT